MITIEIVSDTVCPWCFIGKRRLERALAEHPPGQEVRIGWRPFQLNPDMPEGGMDRRTYVETKFGGPERARAVYERVANVGREEGIPFAFDRMGRMPNTVDSHRMIRFAGDKARQDPVVEGLFRAYFLEGKDIGDIDTLVAVGEAAGLDAAELRAYLESDADAEVIRSEDQMARDLGIQGVPCFIVNRRYAISGAQDPSVFQQIFDMIERGENPADAALRPAAG